MSLVIIASHNPVKIQAAQNGLQRMFPEQEFELRGVSVPSGVSDQPMSSAETLQGAMNRAQNARRAAPQADIWIGIEGGVDTDGEELCAYAWVVVLSSDRCGKGRTGTFYLPKRIAELVKAGKELGEADDIVFGRTNSKQENGAVGILTGDVIDRVRLYEPAVILALIPFKHPDLYDY